MKASYIRLVFLVAAYLQWAPLLCQAQDEIPNAVTSQNRSGELPFSTRIGTDVEHADVSSGNLTVTIAITSLRGRGQNFSFSLRYDARILVAGVRLDPNTGRNYLIWNLEGGPWGINAPSVTSGTHQIVCNPDFGLVANLELGVISTDPNGSKHTLAYQWDDGTQGVCGGIQDTNGPDLTGQGMLATLGASDPEIILSNGTIVTTAGNWTDPNGNQKSEPLGQDTLGRTIVTKQNNGASQILYKIYDSNGVLQTYTVNYTNISIATHFNLPDPWGGTIHELTATRQVVSSIVLPNGRSYQFQYENGSYGGLTRIDLPSGAYVTYTWATLVDNLKAYRSYRYVASRTVNVNGQSSTWNIVSTGNVHALTTTVTDPLSNQTVYLSDSGAVSSAKFYQGAASGTPLRQYAMSYAADDDPQYNEFSSRDPTYEPQEVALRLTGITTTLDNGLVSKKEFDYDTLSYTYHTCIDYPCAGGAPSTFTTSRGNVTEMREYAYAVGAPGPLVRRTTKAYLHDSNPGYLAYNIVDKVIQENVYDSTANTCQGLSQPCVQAVYEYDNYVAGDNPLLATSNAAQHDYTGHGAS